MRRRCFMTHSIAQPVFALVAICVAVGLGSEGEVVKRPRSLKLGRHPIPSHSKRQVEVKSHALRDIPFRPPRVDATTPVNALVQRDATEVKPQVSATQTSLQLAREQALEAARAVEHTRAELFKRKFLVKPAEGNLSHGSSFLLCDGEDAGNSAETAAGALRSVSPLLKPSSTDMRLGCMVHTFSPQRQKLFDQLNTWLSRCDVVYAFSDEEWTVPRFGLTTIKLDLPEKGTTHMWPKVKQMYTHMEKVWKRDELNYLVVADDDTFFILPNLRAQLADIGWNDHPMAIGNVQGSFISGCGYVVNHALVDAVAKCDGRKWTSFDNPGDTGLSSCTQSLGYNIAQDSARYSQKFCAFGVCGGDSGHLVYHYIDGPMMHSLYNSFYSDTEQDCDANYRTRERVCLGAEDAVGADASGEMYGHPTSTMTGGWSLGTAPPRLLD